MSGLFGGGGSLGGSMDDDEDDGNEARTFLEKHYSSRGIRGAQLHPAYRRTINMNSPTKNVGEKVADDDEELDMLALQKQVEDEWKYGNLNPEKRSKWNEVRRRVLSGDASPSMLDNLTGQETESIGVDDSNSINSALERPSSTQPSSGAAPQPREVQLDAKGRAYGTGRRKCSIARVFLTPNRQRGRDIDASSCTVNGRSYIDYFPRVQDRLDLFSPLLQTQLYGQWHIRCTVKGGGLSGQVGAIRLGLARALQNADPSLRPILKKEGLLTRDSRMVERKKAGRKKARKAFPFVKR